MDTLDDFTVLDIIMLCDMRTVFGALPLVCRRMRALHDDVMVARRFRDELRARIEAYNADRAVPPLDLIAKAGLDDFALNVEICIDNAAKTRPEHLWTQYASDTPVRTLRAILKRFQCVRYALPCKLSATFWEICQQVDDVLAEALGDGDRPAYVIYGPSAYGVSQRRMDDRAIYDLGVGYKHTTLMVTVRSSRRSGLHTPRFKPPAGLKEIRCVSMDD